MRLIDADKLRTIRSIQSGDFNSIETIQKWIGDAPTVDAVPVVRCKDCKYAQKEWLSKTLSCDIWWDKFSPEDFCSTGKRRAEK